MLIGELRGARGRQQDVRWRRKRCAPPFLFLFLLLPMALLHALNPVHLTREAMPLVGETWGFDRRIDTPIRLRPDMRLPGRESLLLRLP